MCGLAGLFARPTTVSAPAQLVARMTGTIAHRGPDDHGIWSDPTAGIHLGFRRLAIIDLSAHGHQPMASASGRYTMVFNGEVFNHDALRAELTRDGFRFRGRSDSEVLLAAFERWGIPEAVQRFVGMFAIGVWDAHARALTLVRDRLGIKPLFVHARPGAVSFASELKAIAVDPGFDRELDRDAVAGYLRHLYIAAPRTIYRHAVKLPPGHLLTIADPGAPLPASRAYWSLEDVARRGLADPLAGAPDEILDLVDRQLVDAVRLRMEADVPLGALLSGGIDSSLVVAIMQEHAARPVRTFSVGFDVPEHNEAHHAAAVARHLGTDHTEVMLTGRDALDVVPRLPDLFDEPHADAAQIPAYLVCAAARRDVTVALSGDGGDEVFGGYNRYTHGDGMLRRLERVPASARRVLGAGLVRVSAGQWASAYRAVAPILPRIQRHRLAGEKMVKVAQLLRAGSMPRMYRSLVSAWQQPDSLVVGGREPADAIARVFGGGVADSLLHRMMLADQMTSLPDDHLAKVDRVSSAVSLEVRVPLLDHRLVELSWRLPQGMKVRAGRGKLPLRDALRRRVPDALIERPKVGFTVPLAAWLRGPLRDWAESLLATPALEHGDLLRAPVIRRAWTGLLAGEDERALPVWTVLVLQAWRARWAP